ncbi:hypothetical protein GCM10011316_14770 [Roseibium aquae]|uniref:Transposase n=1 Tax=Roseibium aquae TaxID=1323746 RepID=A0A916TGD0_9HYPH|nr:hypothetical protein GCM10011316_14770 [Roseibium aquae]
MEEIAIIGVELAKNVFQVHGAAVDGSVLFRKKVTQPQFTRLDVGCVCSGCHFEPCGA